MADVAAIILAAGLSSRFSPDETKLVAPLAGAPLVRRVALAALGSRARPVIVVTGWRRESVEAALCGLPLDFVHNPDYASGLASSLRRGVAAAPDAADGALILLGDMPLVTSVLIDGLIGAFAQRLESGAPALAAAPARNGARGNPALIGRGLFPALAALEGDKGARSLIDGAGAGLVEWPVEDDAALIDVDTPEALRRLHR